MYICTYAPTYSSDCTLHIVHRWQIAATQRCLQRERDSSSIGDGSRIISSPAIVDFPRLVERQSHFMIESSACCSTMRCQSVVERCFFFFFFINIFPNGERHTLCTVQLSHGSCKKKIKCRFAARIWYVACRLQLIC